MHVFMYVCQKEKLISYNVGDKVGLVLCRSLKILPLMKSFAFDSIYYLLSSGRGEEHVSAVSSLKYLRSGNGSAISFYV